MNETATQASGLRPDGGAMSQQSRAQAAGGVLSSAERSPAEAWDEAFRRAPQKGLAITAGAAAFGRQKLNARGTPEAAIRLGIKGGGCSGFSYVIQFEDGAPRERDYAYEVDGVRFVVDKKSLIYLAG